MESVLSTSFDDIRPVYDSEVPETIEKLLADDRFRKAVEPVIKHMSWDQWCSLMRSCKTINDFQIKIVYPVLNRFIANTTKEVKGFNWDNIKDGLSHVIISNHRDIVLDAAFLNILLYSQGMDTTEVAIGDNLLIYPWITHLVRLNKSFIVKRSVPIREKLETSRHLSEYIHYTVGERNQSIWIAQREGRAKDSNDHTQVSLLKMMTLKDSSRPIEMLKALRIVPLAISYEFDPCDFLKAKEFQLKRDNPHYKKTPADDLENMLTGIYGYKGRVYFKFGEGINSKLDKLDLSLPKSSLLEAAACIIDEEIYRNYIFYPFNYVAYDIMTNSSSFQSEYTAENKEAFVEYVDKQIDKIQLKNKDWDFLREKIVEMYGNPVKNFLKVQPTPQFC